MTPRMLELLRFVCDHQRRLGYAPSYEEMRDAMNLRSKSGINRMLGQLAELGYVTMPEGKARNIEVLRQPPERGKMPAPLAGAIPRPSPIDMAFAALPEGWHLRLRGRSGSWVAAVQRDDGPQEDLVLADTPAKAIERAIERASNRPPPLPDAPGAMPAPTEATNRGEPDG
jgi:SOS-response transcriptional repressor LexA